MKITLDKHVGDQWNIKVYGRRVGYYTEKKTIAFLVASQCKLTEDQKDEVVRYIAHTLGLPVKGFWKQVAYEGVESG